ncbi:CidA/LrgA family holin-like protein [Sporosarcina sp. GW1-11]|uniref:CidA/LrgA family holin-like protein n=1 Tax=Sporosarcina sp. GW1-11 TaxID=2899126 RepID=UPI00294BF53F|nr:CidA/LrgA family holin-like protein [Sporosarcina sp. GW1-11]MDV6378586.1 CidA/LrgA family holin-like protein [Sporosarcina sp. GW1-11]
MNIVKTLIQVIVLYGFFMLGSFLRETFSIPLPGSIIGLLLLWALLSFRIIPLRFVEKGAYVFLSTLPLYLIPATVGVMNYGYVFVGKGWLLIAITIGSTFITMAVASLVSQSIAKRQMNNEVLS